MTNLLAPANSPKLSCSYYSFSPPSFGAAAAYLKRLTIKEIHSEAYFRIASIMVNSFCKVSRQTHYVLGPSFSMHLIYSSFGLAKTAAYRSSSESSSKFQQHYLATSIPRCRSLPLQHPRCWPRPQAASSIDESRDINEEDLTFDDIRHVARLSRSREEHEAYLKLPDIQLAITALVDANTLEVLKETLNSYKVIPLKIPDSATWLFEEDASTIDLFTEELNASIGCRDVLMLRKDHCMVLSWPCGGQRMGWDWIQKQNKEINEAVGILLDANPVASIINKAEVGYDVDLVVPKQLEWLFKQSAEYQMAFERRAKHRFRCDYVFMWAPSHSIKLTWH